MINTNLPVVIESEFECEKGDVVESVRQQTEIGIFQLQTLFNLLKRSASDVESIFREDETGTVSEFCYDIQNTATLGYGVTMSIWKAISELRESPLTNADDLLTTDDAATVALAVSNLLNNEFVPRAIRESLADALTDLQNGGEQREVLRVESSPAYITGILQDYANSKISA